MYEDISVYHKQNSPLGGNETIIDYSFILFPNKRASSSATMGHFSKLTTVLWVVNTMDIFC